MEELDKTNERLTKLERKVAWMESEMDLDYEAQKFERKLRRIFQEDVTFEGDAEDSGFGLTVTVTGFSLDYLKHYTTRIEGNGWDWQLTQEEDSEPELIVSNNQDYFA